jgi:type IV secretory pathway VirD2 relaxase
MVWLPWKTPADDEAGLKLGPLKAGRGRRARRLVPWWERALRRGKAATVMRRQSRLTAGGGGAVRRVSAAGVYGRRSVVKVSYQRNRGKGGWVRHARYLGREHAQHEHERGLGFNGEGEGLDLVATVRPWERSDALWWKGNLSPEDAARLDLVAHTRALVAGMERDLGTRLEWVAIDHHNTDNPHVHLLIRGVRDDGRVLQLDRDYVSRGIRELSQELIERELGPRTEHEVLLARERVIEREQWTEIDRALARRAGPERVLSYREVERPPEQTREDTERAIDSGRGFLEWLWRLDRGARESARALERAAEERDGLSFLRQVCVDRARVVSYADFAPRTEGALVRAEQEIARLAYLEKLGLARRVGEREWELTPEHEPELRKRQLDHDIIKSRARERQLERDRGRDRGPELER